MAYVHVQERKLPFVLRYCGELLAFRHLCWNLVGSDLRSRFRRSHLGIFWAILQPLSFSLVIAVVWGRVFQVENYWEFALYVFSGMLLWEYFSNTFQLSQDALIHAEGYLKQMRIPFFVFQVRTPLTGLVIFCFGTVGLVVLLAVLGRIPPLGWHLLLIPAYLPIVLMFMIPLATIMSVVGTQFRDLRHISQVALQALMFVSPVMLSRDILQAPELHFMRILNPIVPLADLFRGPILDGQFWSSTDLITISVWIAALWMIALMLQIRAGRRLVFAI